MIRHARRRRGAFLLVPLLVALGACGGADDGGERAGDPEVATTTSSFGEGGTTGPEAAPSTTTGGAGATSSPTTPEDAGDPGGVIDLTITGGAVEGGVRRASVKQGSQVTIRATSDAADELHLHTYDLRADLVPGQSADITFLAKTTGVFTVELEKRGTKVLELEVRP